MNINCAIIDDEPLAINLIRGYVERTPMLKLKYTFTSATDALPYLNIGEIQLLFLDIQMPEISGLDFAKLIPDDIRIVYTTAYSEYAIDSYRVNALDYLLKPIDYDDFLKSVEKALKYFRNKRDNVENDVAGSNTNIDNEENIFVKSEYKLIRILKSEILFIEGLKDYIKIYTTTAQKPILTLTSMHAMEECLNKPHFLRVHRSYIVNMMHVSHYERGKIIFGKHEIQVSDSGKERVKEYINQRLVCK